METIRFKNRFRITYNGKVLALNSMTNQKGYLQLTPTIETLDGAVKLRRAYAAIRGIEEQAMGIESYSETLLHWVPSFSIEASDYFRKTKTFSGRGLRYKGLESPKDSKYVASRYYGQEVQFAKSVEFNKGNSTLPKEKRKKFSGVPDTYEALTKRSFGTLNLGDSLVESLKKRGLGKKSLRRYLRTHGYSVSQAISICERVFTKE